jgi:hypothetical protein
MGFANKARLAMLGIAGAMVLAGSGCAGERDPINQVQVGAMPKSFFIGEKFADTSDDPEFYFRTTVVDVASAAGSESLFTNSDAQPTVRIRWEVTETELNARLSYELINDTDKQGTNSPTPRADDPRTPDKPARTTQDGQIVASFTIVKQFDIRRDYNSSTGEENNIILENDKDRPWQEREYIRVDWSKNLITDAYDLDAASQIGLDGAVKWDPIGYYVSDPTSPDAPLFDIQNGYLDITTKAYASPQVISDPDYGDFPACLLVGAYPQVNCNPSEVKLRHSFRKLANTDYEPEDYGGKPMELFGFFTDDRYGYDRRYGIVDDRWHRFISRWNIWQKSHDDKLTCNTPDNNVTPPGADPHRDLDKNGTEDECENIGRGSRCDEFTHLCTIPLRDRKIRTIPWYVNRDFPADIFDSIKKVVDTWSDAIRVGVASGRLTECRRTKDGGCEAQAGNWPARWSDDWVPEINDAIPRIMVLCHNPVDPSVDDPACGEKDLSPRIGDLRYNLISYITAPQFSEPWGIMVDAEDPLTGEKVAGSVNQWGAVLDRAANTLADLVQLINGTIPPDQYIQGQNVSDWVRDSQRGAPQTMTNAMSVNELSSRLAAFDPKVMTPFMTGKPKGHAGTPRARMKARMQALETAGKMPMGDPAILQRFEKLKGSQIEAKMITPEMAQMSGFDPTASMSSTIIKRASPFSRVSPRMRRTLDRKGLLGRSNKHACRREAPEPDHLLGLARKAVTLFGSVDPKDAAGVKAQHEKIVAWARQNYAVGVFSHEFGHSMGLRHNFAGTFDAASYDNHYWELRTKSGTVTKTCAAGNTDGEGCIGPRYTDPITQGEIDGGIGGFSTSSVMDYPGDQALDMYLIGKYDKAAMRMGYGGTVDVWNEIGTVQNKDAAAYTALGLDDAPGLFGVKYFPKTDGANYDFIHYTQFAQIFNLVSGCRQDKASPTGTTCNGPAMDVVAYRDMKDFTPIAGYDDSTLRSAVDDKGRVRRGYMFSSDEFADTGNIPSFRYDAGADPYEQIRFLESAYENRYILDAFRRNRTMFNSFDTVARVQSHYLDSIQMIAKSFAFGMVLENDDPTNPTPTLLSDGEYGPAGVGTSVAFDLFARMLTRPEPGYYCSTADQNCPGVQPYGLENNLEVADPSPNPAGVAYDFRVALGNGRYIHNDFDYGQGYWWSDYQKQVGSFYEKTIAIYYLSEAFDDFVSNSKEDFVDGRYKNVNFATIYPNQMRRLFGSLLTGDADTYSPWQDGPKGQDAAAVFYPQWHVPADLGARPATAKLLDPAFGWNEQLYTMVWGTIFLPTAWTQDFINDARITALASEQISWPAAETIVFVDPVTNITYRSHTIGTEKLFGSDREQTIGARMIDWANNMLCVGYTCSTDAQGYTLLNADGTPKLKLDAKSGKPILNPDYPGGDAALRKYVTNIEVMRQLVTLFARPLEDDLPNP